MCKSANKIMFCYMKFKKFAIIYSKSDNVLINPEGLRGRFAGKYPTMKKR